MNRFQVINNRTGAVVASCNSRQLARNARDRADLRYGAAVHTVREVTAGPAPLGAGISHSDRAGLL
jgi:hypothetical protein